MRKNLLVGACLLSAVVAQAQHDTTIVISSSGGLQFDQKRLIVRPNTCLKLVFHIGDNMAHNLVVTRPNSRLRVVEFALALGAKGPLQNPGNGQKKVMNHLICYTLNQRASTIRP